MTCHWISTEYFTVMVKTDDKAVVVWAAPLVRRFIGQQIGHLLNWSIPFKGMRHKSWPAERRERRPV